MLNRVAFILMKFNIQVNQSKDLCNFYNFAPRENLFSITINVLFLSIFLFQKHPIKAYLFYQMATTACACL